jgi:RNA polymerase sigma-70 factor (ECF subfamily)
MSPLCQIIDRESISMAFLVLLESLSPLERAVFLLREVFDFEYTEVAQITGRDEAACRQLFSRAKKHISQNRPRFPASPEAHAKMVGHFMQACLAGDIDGLMSLLAEDVTLWIDGGSRVAVAGGQPIQGRGKVARGIIGHLLRAPQVITADVIEVNGLPALLGRVNGQIVSVLMLEVEGDFIRAIRTITNPDKLVHLRPLPMSTMGKG